MSTSVKDRTLQIIDDHHEQIAGFARSSYQTDGRGVIQLSLPNVPVGQAIAQVRMMKYVTLDELRRLTNNGADEESAVLIRMVDTYEPSRQAVVIAAIDGELPISIKMKLEKPTIVDEADGVH